AMLVARGEWDVKHMVNVEELEAKPFIDLLDTMGLPTEINEAPVAFTPPIIESLESV
ncbi:MAG: Saccharopine dehydrogenase, partial [Firmicutes bacterium]|nr:Saccharopine dehydrogenase [Bacillota bacterium]